MAAATMPDKKKKRSSSRRKTTCTMTAAMPARSAGWLAFLAPIHIAAAIECEWTLVPFVNCTLGPWQRLAETFALASQAMFHIGAM